MKINLIKKKWHSIFISEKVSEAFKIGSWFKNQILQNGEFLVDFGKRNRLTVQRAAGTQFHSQLSVHSVLVQGELYPIMTKNIINSCLFC